MSENEILVAESAAENVEQTTEETPVVKTYTQDEVDAIVGKAKARTKAKIEKDYQRKYGGLEDVLKAGTQKESVEEITDMFADFYRNKGVNIPQKPSYTARDIEVLSRAEAEDIIRAGYDEVVEEVDRLSALGASNMTDREKAVFKVLAEHRQNAERSHELSKIGVTEDVYNSQAFKDFAGMFNPNTPIRDVYDIYAKTLPKKDIKPMGSMKQSPVNEVKDYYSPEEIEKLSMKDLSDPVVWAAVRASMTGKKG